MKPRRVMGTLLVAALAAGGALPLAEPAAAQDARVRDRKSVV